MPGSPHLKVVEPLQAASPRAPRPAARPTARPSVQASPRDAAIATAPFMVPVLDLLTPAFMLRCTSHRDLQSLLGAGGLHPQGLSDLTERPSASWDAFIARSSRFANWAALLSQARGEWLARRLGWVNDTC